MEVEEIEELIHVLEKSEVSELSLRKGDWGVTIRKGRPSLLVREGDVSRASEDQTCPRTAEAPELETPSELEITAPMVGIFHAIELGPKTEGQVQSGQVVGVIESMKLMNDVRAEVGGAVVAVLAEDGMPVEYGQPLFRLSPLPAKSDKEAS